VSGHRNTEDGYCESWRDKEAPEGMAEDVGIDWPDHAWAGTDDGHECTGCAAGGVWECDIVAHRIGDWLRTEFLGEPRG
jgi:hypothetical protein